MSAPSPPNVAVRPQIALHDLRPIELPRPGDPSPVRRWSRCLVVVPLVGAVLAGSTGLRVDVDGVTAERRAAAGPSDAPGVPRGAPSAPRTGRPEPSPPRRLTLAFSGDVLVHQAVWELAAEHGGGDPAFDFRPMFAAIRPVVSRADVAICHLETPLSPDDADLASYPLFETPHELASAIAWAGYDGCSTASNHSLDGGTDGVRATLRRLDRAGLDHAGTARTPREATRITTYEVDGAVIAHLSATWGFNGFTPDEPWLANRIDVPALIADARRARRAGADLVVVSLHWGVEYTHEPTAWQVETAELLTRSPSIDLLVGHHAHVVQPIDRVHGTWVAYGLGNHLSGMTSSLGTDAVRDGVVLVAVADRDGDRWEIERVRAVPTRVEEGTWRILPIPRMLRRADLDTAIRAELIASRDRTDEVVGAS